MVRSTLHSNNFLAIMKYGKFTFIAMKIVQFYELSLLYQLFGVFTFDK